MAERLEIVINNNIELDSHIIQMIAEDFIEWQNAQSST